MHASMMIFLFIIPMLAGFGNYVVPLMIGAPDMAFPRINALSFWMLPLAAILLLLRVRRPAAPRRPAGRATRRCPRTALLAGPARTSGSWASSSSGRARSSAAINFLVTIFKMRAPGMTMFRMPILVWTVLVTSDPRPMATPVLTSALIMLFIDRNYGGHFFDPASGGNAILWQNVFWFYSHPAVYIMVLPAMGMVSEVLPVFTRKPLFGYKAFVFATAGIGALGLLASGPTTCSRPARSYLPFFSLMTFLIAVPTGVKMFNWIVTLWRGQADVLDAAAVRARLPVDVPHRRDQRRVQRGRAGRLRPPRHVLGRRPPPLRAVRRLGLRRSSPGSTTGSRR